MCPESLRDRVKASVLARTMEILAEAKEAVERNEKDARVVKEVRVSAADGDKSVYVHAEVGDVSAWIMHYIQYKDGEVWSERIVAVIPDKSKGTSVCLVAGGEPVELPRKLRRLVGELEDLLELE